MKDFLEKYMSNWRKSKQLLRMHHVVLAILVLVVGVTTAWSLRQNADTISHKMLCKQEEHIHTIEDCYDVEEILICDKEHEHNEKCYQRIATLTCKKEQHEHIDMCYADHKSDDKVFGQAYIEEPILVVDEKNQIKDEKPVMSPNEIQTFAETTPTTGTTDPTNPTDPTTDPTNPPADTTPPPAGYETALNLANYESTVRPPIIQRKIEGNQWETVTEETQLKITDEIQILYYYTGISDDTLKTTANYQAYYKIPEPFSSVLQASSPVNQGGTKICDVEPSENKDYLIFTYDKTWVDKPSADSTISGYFGIDVKLKPDLMMTEDRYTVHFTRKEQTIIMEPDWASKSSKIDVIKHEPTAFTDSTGSYLQYTLDVTNLNTEFAAPEVSIVDEVTSGNGTFFDDYVGITDAKVPLKDSTDPTHDASVSPFETRNPGAVAGEVYQGKYLKDDDAGQLVPLPGSKPSSDKNETLVWYIEKLEPGETRSLTYRIKLKDSGVESWHIYKKKGLLNNAAWSFSKTYKTYDEKATTNKVNYIFNNIFSSIGKNLINDTVDADGNRILTYRIYLTANKNNHFPFKNLTIRDDFFDHYSGQGTDKPTDDRIKPYTTILDGEYNLYTGQYSGAGTIPSDRKVDKNLYTVDIDPNGKYFQLHYPIVNPSDSFTFEYNVKIGKEAMLVTNGSYHTNNAVGVDNDGNAEYGPIGTTCMERFQTQEEISSKTWSRKGVFDNAPLAESKVVTILDGDKVFDDLNVENTTPDREFTVPKGSYHYYVVINEDADWNLTKATFKDELGDLMRFIRYARVTTYSIPTKPDNKLDDSQIYEFVSKHDPVATSWFNIHGKQSFEFTPEAIGLPNDKYAYILDYYAVPYGVEHTSTANVSNAFEVYGNVGDGYSIVPGAMKINVSVAITGSEKFQIDKTGWYFQQPNVDTDGTIIEDPNADYNNGKMYWVMKVDGVIKAGRIIQDESFHQIQSTIAHMLYPDSVIGVYKGELPEGISVKDYIDVNDFETRSGLEKLSVGADGDYSVQFIDDNNYDHLNIIFNKDVSLLPDESAYIIIATEPSTGMNYQEETEFRTYTNKANTSEDGGTTFTKKDEAVMNIATKEPIYKATRAVYDVAGNGDVSVIYNSNPQGATEPQTQLMSDRLENGSTYIEWRIRVNWTGEIEGVVNVEDKLPDGVTPTYVNLLSVGQNYTTEGLALQKPTTILMDELLSEGYTKQPTVLNQFDNTLSCDYYYNDQTNSLKWKVGPLASGGTEGVHEAVFQVVAKVNDKQYLTNLEPCTIVNSFEAKLDNGKVYSGSANTEFTKVTMTKTSGDREPSAVNRIPFTIDANPKAQILNPDPAIDNLVISDELSKKLEILPQTIQVYEIDATTGVETELAMGDWKVELEETDEGTQIVKFTIPDGKHIKVKYEVVYLAPSGQSNSISNIAHWDGSPAGDSSKWENPSYHFGVTGGAIITQTYCSLKVKKVGADDILTGLPNATFTLQECAYDSNTNTISLVDGTLHTETTDATGELTFSNFGANQGWMKVNTIYCLKETVAPSGYKLNGEPYYFIVAHENESGFPEIVNNPPENVFVSYASDYIYQYTAIDQRGRVGLDKKFANADNNNLSAIDGTYVFGIYNVENPDITVTPLQKLEIVYKDGVPTYRRTNADGEMTTARTPRFNNLEVRPDKKYYIYELDETGCPILEGSVAEISNEMFTVKYTGNGVILSSTDSTIPTITVNNHPTYQLPETGGMGTAIYYILGLLIIIIGLIASYYNNKKIKTKNLVE